MQLATHILSVVGFSFLKALPPAVAVVIAAVLNPLDVVTATDRASQDIFFRHIAPFYSDKDEPITVMMFDDHFLKTVGASWPLSHRTMTRFLKTLYCYRPKGIFFDLIFTHEHSKVRHTWQFIDHLKQDGEVPDAIATHCQNYLGDAYREVRPLPPTYIGDRAPQKNYAVDGGTAVFDKLIERGVARLPTNWVADDGAYPLVIDLDGEAAFGAVGALEGEHQTELWDKIWPGHVDGRIPSAALALYAAIDRKRPIETLIAEEQHELIVEWGFYPRHLPKEALTEEELKDDEKLRLRRFPKGCSVRPDGFLGRFGESIRQALLDTDLVGRFDPNPGQPRQTCPYNQWIPAEGVLFATGDAQKETLRQLFEGRVVMIGANIKGAPDLVQSPVHGQIPGVFLHAMALDNLLRFELQHYWRPMPVWTISDHLPAGISKIPLTTFIEFGMLLGVFWISSLVSYWRNRWGERWSNFAYAGVEILSHMVLVFGTIAILAAMAYAPMNWLGLLTLAIGKDIIQRFQLPKFDNWFPSRST